MKRVKAGCILQTLVFTQKDGSFLSKAAILDANRREIERYFSGMDRTHTRYQIVSQEEQDDGSIVLRVSQQMSTTQKLSEIVILRPEKPGIFAFYGTFDDPLFLR